MCDISLLGSGLSESRAFVLPGVDAFATRRSVTYTLIDPDFIKRAHRFIDSSIDFTVAARIKDSYTFAGNVSFTFGGEEIDDELMPIKRHLILLMKSGRRWRDVCGFIGIQNLADDRKILMRNLQQQQQQKQNQYSSTNPTTSDTAPTDIRQVYAEVLKQTSGISPEIDAKLQQLITPDQAALVSVDTQQPDDGERTQKARTLEQTLLDTKYWRIVEPEEGYFYVETDNESRERRVVFVRQTRDQVGLPAGQITPEKIDRSVYVHVWDQLMPRSDGTLVTQMQTLLDSYDRAITCAATARAAEEFAAQRRDVFTTTVPAEQYKLDRMSDADIYNGKGVSPDEIERGIIDKAMRQIQNSERSDQFVRSLAAMRVGQTEKPKLPVAFAQNTSILLPNGIGIGHVGEPRVLCDREMERFLWTQSFSRFVNVPIPLLESGAGGASTRLASNASSAANELTQERITSMIIYDRSTLRFIEDVWDIMYRDIDTETLADFFSAQSIATERVVSEKNIEAMQLLRDLNSVVDQAAEDTKGRITDNVQAIETLLVRIDRIKEKVARVSAQDRRFQVVFGDSIHIDQSQLAALKDCGAIDEYEYANINLAKAGMEPREDSVIKHNLEEQQKKREAEAAIQPGKKPKL